MKIKIKSYNGELPNYLTLNKEYECEVSASKRGAIFVDDNGELCAVKIKKSCHLNGGDWELIGA